MSDAKKIAEEIVNKLVETKWIRVRPDGWIFKVDASVYGVLKATLAERYVEPIIAPHLIDEKKLVKWLNDKYGVDDWVRESDGAIVPMILIPPDVLTAAIKQCRESEE